MIFALPAEVHRGCDGAGIDTACCSLPRGNGKSWLGGRLAPASWTLPMPCSGGHRVGPMRRVDWSRQGSSSVRPAELEPRGGYRVPGQLHPDRIVHKATNTRLRVIGSNGGRRWGWWVVHGRYAMTGRMGDQRRNAAPGRGADRYGQAGIAVEGDLHRDAGAGRVGLVARPGGGRLEQHALRPALQGDPERWDSWYEIRRCNPLTAISPAFRRSCWRNGTRRGRTPDSRRGS